MTITTEEERVAKMTDAAKKRRLAYLSGMLAKYSHRWGEYPSLRMYAWVDEYEHIRLYYPDVYVEFCRERGWSPSSSAYDSLA